MNFTDAGQFLDEADAIDGSKVACCSFTSNSREYNSKFLQDMMSDLHVEAQVPAQCCHIDLKQGHLTTTLAYLSDQSQVNLTDGPTNESLGGILKVVKRGTPQIQRHEIKRIFRSNSS